MITEGREQGPDESPKRLADKVEEKRGENLGCCESETFFMALRSTAISSFLRAVRLRLTICKARQRLSSGIGEEIKDKDSIIAEKRKIDR